MSLAQPDIRDKSYRSDELATFTRSPVDRMSSQLVLPVLSLLNVVAARLTRRLSRVSRPMYGDFSKCESYTSTQQAEDKPGLSGLSGLFGLSRVFG